MPPDGIGQMTRSPAVTLLGPFILKLLLADGWPWHADVVQHIGRAGWVGEGGLCKAGASPPNGLLRPSRGREAVADAVLVEDIGGIGRGVAELVAELLDGGAHAIGVVRAPAPPHLAQ